jgi:deazaflavin-dependent oxidoreductase (nitroreductase family)
MWWQRLYNPFVVALLRSPLHGFMSGSTMLLTYAGRKSGKAYTTPVNYLRDGDTLLVVSSREHIWWKNLRGGAPVTVRVRGKEMRGVGVAFEGEAAEGGLLTVLRRVPAYRRYFGVELAADGNPEDPEALPRVADSNAVVRIKDLAPKR